MELTTSELRPLLISLLENQKEGLHVKQLALDVYSSQQTLFDVSSGNPVDENLPSFEILLNKIQTILAADVKKKNSTFQRVINPKTKKPKNCILNPQDSDNISIKIRFKDGVPYIYHNNNEEDITFYQSRFL